MDYTTEIDENAARFGIPPALIRAVIQVESAGDTWATRFEPHYRWLWDPFNHKPFRVNAIKARLAHPPKGMPSYSYSSDATEWAHQKTSWGLMQVMGAVAREYGFSQQLTTLCRPGRGIEYGCRHLARLRDRWFDRHGWAGVLDGYNDGNPDIERKYDYPHKVAAVSGEAAAAAVLER